MSSGSVRTSVQFDVVRADITALKVDAIVNAANKTLLGGGGVDGAIHRTAGPKLLAECLTIGGCPTGEARITGGYELPSRHVIHTVGPVWQGGDADEDVLLASCYRSSLKLAREHDISTIAFPAISTGVYGFPANRAAAIAVKTVSEIADDDPGSVELIIFCCFNQSAADYHRAAISVLQRARG